MDVPRPHRRRRGLRWLTAGAVLLAAVALATIGIGRLRAAAPSIPRSSLLIDTVERGEMLRSVQGQGTLVPEYIQWVTALDAGRVERIHVRPGTPVAPDTILLELRNPDLELQSLEAQRQVTEAEAQLANLRASLEAERLAQESVVATLRTDLATARRRAAADSRLGERGYVAPLDEASSASQVEVLATRLALEEKRLATLSGGMEARLAAQKAQVARLRAIGEFRVTQIAALRIPAGAAGVLQELPLEAGQWVSPGALLAKVAQPDRLKAQIKVPETLAKDVAIGQQAAIDTQNGVVAGRVARIDPASRGGTVLVDVVLDGALPKGARPDLAVVGTIELERLVSVLHVGRPAFAQPDSAMQVFKLVDGGRAAARVTLRLGRASATDIEVLGGLQEGDRIVLSDMSEWDAHDRVRLE